MDACPRGHGALSLGDDQYGQYRYCRFCGFHDPDAASGEGAASITKKKTGYQLKLPTGPTNYTPWRDRNKPMLEEVEG